MVYQSRLKNSLGKVYLKIQPKISHNQLIFKFLTNNKDQETKICKNYETCQPLEDPRKLFYFILHKHKKENSNKNKNKS